MSPRYNICVLCKAFPLPVCSHISCLYMESLHAELDHHVYPHCTSHSVTGPQQMIVMEILIIEPGLSSQLLSTVWEILDQYPQTQSKHAKPQLNHFFLKTNCLLLKKIQIHFIFSHRSAVLSWWLMQKIQ